MPLAVALVVLATLALPMQAEARAAEKPELVLGSERYVGDVQIGLSVIDYREVRLDPDAEQGQNELEFSVALARGVLPEPDEDSGLIESRNYYEGPLQLAAYGKNGEEKLTLTWPNPNSPMSAQKRRIYSRRTHVSLEPGERVVLQAVEGWTDAPVTWTVPHPGTTLPTADYVHVTLASLLLFAGLMSLSLVTTSRRASLPTPPTGRL